MKNKPVILIGAAVVVCIIIGIFLIGKKGTAQNNQTQTNNSLFGEKQIKVGDDVCGEFPKEWVKTAIGIPIIRTEAFNTNIIHVCNYFVTQNGFVSIHHETYNVENQKKGLEFMGRKLKQDPRIKMDHFIAWQDDGLINNIYLILGESEYLTVSRSSGDVVDNEKNIQLAIQVVERIQTGENVAVSGLTPTSQASVPLPQGEDIVRNFFTLIGEGKIEDAVGMLTPNIVSNDSQKQAWGVQFNAFKKILVKKVEPAVENTYKVTLDVEMKPESASAPIPFYGYDKGENIRWVTLEKINNVWKITGIATGP